MTEASPQRQRSALVTGSCVRTGRAIAVALASRGWHVVVHGKATSLVEAEYTARACYTAGGEATVVLSDISTREGCESLVAQMPPGPLDLLVHNVGIYPRGSALETSPEILSQTLRTNLEAPWILTNLLVPRMERGSSIVAMGYAGLQRLAATSHATAYSISKTGLLLLVRSLAQELGPRGIRVNMISPGQLENSVDLPPDISERVPLGRAGSVDEVVKAILWLSSEESSYVTGQNLDVAGGLML